MIGVIAAVEIALAPILVKVLLEPLILLFVSVSVVSRPTKVSVDVGRVSVPVLLMVEIIGELRVLLVRLSVPASVAKVPVVGNVTLVVPMVVNVRE